MKLYFAPGACSLSPHIVVREAGIVADLEQVDLKTKKTKSGADFTAVNPKGQVPTLLLDSGQTLTEGPVIVQYLADQRPQSGLAPQAGTFERYRLQEWLNFITAEIHKPFGALFTPSTPDDYKSIAKETLANRFAYVDRHLASGGPYLMGAQFTVADAYLFVMTLWAGFMKIDLGQWARLKAYAEQVAARPKVHEALKEEGLAK
ncbi:MAG TPA: glutathione transferase GstA [Candidatus Binataceae bacterium]|nr:glutathione transferase GstA [Candidatus Binataceae bacterium]